MMMFVELSSFGLCRLNDKVTHEFWKPSGLAGPLVEELKAQVKHLFVCPSPDGGAHVHWAERYMSLR